MDSEV